MNELLEFGNRMLEIQRQSLEDKIVSVSRSVGSLTYPATSPYRKIASRNNNDMEREANMGEIRTKNPLLWVELAT